MEESQAQVAVFQPLSQPTSCWKTGHSADILARRLELLVNKELLVNGVQLLVFPKTGILYLPFRPEQPLFQNAFKKNPDNGRHWIHWRLPRAVFAPAGAYQLALHPSDGQFNGLAKGRC